jgi:DNA repair protein RecN (Recombination protein N)
VYAELKSAIAQRAEIQENREARQREAEDIAELLDEVDALELHGNDLEQLKDEAGRLGHVDEIAAAVDRALGLLRGEGSAEVESLLASAGSALDTVRSHDSRVADLHTRLIQSATEIADLVVELAGVADSLEADPQRLEWIEARRARITAALRPGEQVRHAGSVFTGER